MWYEICFLSWKHLSFCTNRLRMVGSFHFSVVSRYFFFYCACCINFYWGQCQDKKVFHRSTGTHIRFLIAKVLSWKYFYFYKNISILRWNKVELYWKHQSKIIRCFKVCLIFFYYYDNQVHPLYFYDWPMAYCVNVFARHTHHPDQQSRYINRAYSDRSANALRIKVNNV